MEISEKIVDFNKWCAKCVHCDIPGGDEPCNGCLYEPFAEDGKPVGFQEK